jgi:transcriptional antiterminator NusG
LDNCQGLWLGDFIARIHRVYCSYDISSVNVGVLMADDEIIEEKAEESSEESREMDEDRQEEIKEELHEVEDSEKDEAEEEQADKKAAKLEHKPEEHLPEAHSDEDEFLAMMRQEEKEKKAEEEAKEEAGIIPEEKEVEEEISLVKKKPSKKKKKKDEEFNEEVVEQSTEPRIYALRTTANREDQVMSFVTSNAARKKLEVYSVVRPHGMRGYIFVEAGSRGDAEQAAFGVPYARGLLPSIIQYSEIEHMLEQVKKEANIQKNDIAEIISGPFKREKAKITRIDKAKEEVVVELLEAAVPIPLTLKMDAVRVIRRDESGGASEEDK